MYTAATGGRFTIDDIEWQQLTTYRGVDTYPSWALKVKPLQIQVCVWPGDTNNDGAVNEWDVFPIAVNWGKQGFSRKGFVKWQPQIAVAWDSIEATYADADGDGEVNANDILPISINWGKSHPVIKGMRSPAFSLKEINHIEHIREYQTMYEMLDQVPETEGVAELKQALQQFMDAAVKASDTSSVLMQNYPNPFNSECWIPYKLAEQTHVVVKIYNISGQLIRVLDEGIKDAGQYVKPEQAAYWDGKNEDGEEAASGVYLYQMQIGKEVMNRRAVVLK